METLVYPRERTLGTITLVLGLIVWAAILIGTVGIVLVYLLLGFVAYLFAQSALIAYIKNTAVRLTPQQFPDLHARFVACCKKLQMETPPEAYVLAGNGLLNGFATRFLGRHFVVLLSDVVDAMEAEPDGLNFYIGHELGHIRMKHLTSQWWRWPVLWLPLIGAAYSRAKETTCDRHGLACCENPESAARALVVLAAGTKRWQTVDVRHYAMQARDSNGFWSAFHELTGGYPWLTKRVARVVKPDARMPGRNPFAYLLALFVPYGGRLGGAAGPLIVVAMIGVLAAVALPAYQDYTLRAKVSTAWAAGAGARSALTAFYEKEQRAPASLEEAGLAAQLADGNTLSLNPKTMVLTVGIDKSELMMAPQLDDQGAIRWYCVPGEGLSAKAMPASCRAPAGS
jgi:Zn-dependent protease with chaperone function/Tfp pilus assembly protein PilE